MAAVLAKVTARTLDAPRGPDVLHRIRVERDWFEAGELVEFEVPRNLACAACEGGGCDVCDRAGAITLRGRQEPPELLRVKLPNRPAEEVEDGPNVIVRIPEQGGLPQEGSALPRGLLLLRIDSADVADAGVRRVAASVAPFALTRPLASVRPLLRSLRRVPGRWLAAAVLTLLLVLSLLFPHWFGGR